MNTYQALETGPYYGTYALLEGYTYAVLEAGVERRVASEGLNVDINAPGERRLASAGLTIDVTPPLIGERQAGFVGTQVDFTYPRGVQFGGLVISADLVPVSSKRLGNIGLMIDFVPSLVPTTAVRWQGTLFEMGTPAPLVYWSSDAFVASGTRPVIWQDDHFEVAP